MGKSSSTRTVRSWTRRGALGGFLAATLLAAACGGGGGGAAAPSSGSGAPPAEGVPADAVSITATPQNSPLPEGTPGAGKPAVVIGSIASSRPTPSSGRPRVERVSVSMTVAPVVPAVAAEPTIETNAIMTYCQAVRSMPKNCATKIAAIAG